MWGISVIYREAEMFNFKFDIEARLKFQVKRDIQSSILKFAFEGDAWNWAWCWGLKLKL